MAVCKTLRAFPNGFHFRIQAHRIDNLHSGGRARGRLPRPPCAPSRPTKPHPFANDAQQKGEVRLRTRWPSAKTAVARRSRAKASCPPASQPSSAASAPHFSTPNFRPFPFRYLCPSVPIRVQVVQARINKGFLEAMDGHCQRICQHGAGLKHNLPLTG